MILRRPQLELHRVVAVPAPAGGLVDGAIRAARAAVGDPAAIRAVVVATFSNPRRFPALAVRLVSELGLDSAIPAFDVQLACSAFPYALFLAAGLADRAGGRVLVVDGDVQTPLVDASDHATGRIFGDAVTACTVGVGDGESDFAFLNEYDEALTCPAQGPIGMDGFKVFSFVAVKVSKFLKDFLAATAAPDRFVPHQANPYMVRQLARSLALEDRLLTLDARFLNPGSCSVPLTIAASADRLAPGARLLVAGFGAGYSAAAATLCLAADFSGEVLEGE